METLWFLECWNAIFLIYFLLTHFGYLILNILSFWSIQKYLKTKLHKAWVQKFNRLDPPISIIAPAYNEQYTIVSSVQAMLKIEYAQFEVVVVCDGPKDNTLEELIKGFDLVEVKEPIRKELEHKRVLSVYRSVREPNLKVILKENGGKADALNCGINACEYPLFCAIDADSLLEGDSLSKLAEPFLSSPNTCASGGVVRIANGSVIESGVVKKVLLPKTQMEKMQIVEYLSAYFLGRMGWVALDSIMIISGALGLFSKKAVLRVGGYKASTVGEDMELVLRLRNENIRSGISNGIAFVPDAVCWTQCPEDFKTLGNQRRRWQRGLWESLFVYKSLMFHPKGGVLSFVAFPFFVFIEALGPLFELMGYAIFILAAIGGFVSWEVFFYLLILSTLLGFILSISALLIEEVFFHNYSGSQLVQLLWSALLDSMILRYIKLWWRVQGMVQFFQKKTHWGEMKRMRFERS